METSGSNSAHGAHISTAVLEIEASSPVVHLDLVNDCQAGVEPSSYAVLAVHEDGDIRCVAEDLSKQYWISNAKSLLSDGDRQTCIFVQCAAVLTVDQARKSFLKSRGDIAAVPEADFGSTTQSRAAPSILCVVLRVADPKNTPVKSPLYVRLLSISVRSASSDSRIAVRHRPIEELMSMKIPEPSTLGSKDSTCYLHEGSGFLYQYGRKGLAVYDLTSPVPHLRQHVQPDQQITSCLHLGSTTVALTSHTEISLLDTRYLSLQSTLPFKAVMEAPGEQNTTKKPRKMPSDIQILSYFSPLDALIGLQGRSLIMFQISGSHADEPRKRKRVTEGTLINAIGQGINCIKVKCNDTTATTNLVSQVLGSAALSDETSKEWQDKTAELDSHIEKGNIEQFDATMVLALEGQSVATKNDRESSPRREQMLSREGKLKAGQHKVAYALSKIFIYGKSSSTGSDTGQSAGQDMQPRLGIRILPPITFRRLVENGYVSLQHVESALRRTKAVPITTSLDPTALLQALVAFDESLQTLDNLLAGSIYLGTQEVAYALRVALEGSKHSKNEQDLKMITNGEFASDQGLETAMQKVHDGNEVSQLSGDPGGQKMHTAHHVIRACLTRLYHCHEPDVRKALKKELSRSDLIFFVDYLRMELAQGGWLSRYVEDLSILPEEHLQHGKQISIAAKLLNCAMDSLGTGGWILGSPAEYNIFETGDTITYMKAEISAALEGIEEAAYLQGMLQEVLLYSKTARRKSPELDEASQRPKKVKPITVPLEDELSHALPLGVKGPPQVSLTKVGAGGEIQVRSMRDIGRLKSQQVGKYSFERILI